MLLRMNRILLMLGGIASLLFLFACNTQTLPSETELKFKNPSSFASDVDSIVVKVKYGGKEVPLFQGKKTKPGFDGPWSVVVTDYADEPLELIILTFGANRLRLNEISITYRNVGGRLAQDTSIYFAQSAVAVNLKDSVLKLEWASLPAENLLVPVLTSSNPSLVAILDSKTARLLDTGRVDIVIRLGATLYADTLKVQVYSGSVLPIPASPDSIRFAADSVKLVVGISEFPLVWNIHPKAYSGSVSCRTDAPTVLKLTGSTAVTPLASGRGLVICTIDGTLLSDTLKVAIPEAAPGNELDSIRFAQDTVTLFVGGAPAKPAFAVYPATAKPVLAWTISNPIAMVDTSGVVTPLSQGNAILRVFAAGVKLVKDSLYLRIVDTSSNTKPRWTLDTLHVALKEGQSISIELADSIQNPSHAAVEFIKGRLSPQAALIGSKYTFKAGARDSGVHHDLVVLKQGAFLDSVLVRVKVDPVYFTLTLTATNGTVAAKPALARYRFGDSVSLTATPAAGFGFFSWTGDGSGQSNPNSLIMNADKSVGADFQPMNILACTDLPTGESLHAGLRKIYQSAARKGTLCPAPGARLENRTLEILGKVQFLVR